MKRIVLLAMIFVLRMSAAGSGVALADGATGVSVQPLIPKPGDVITVKGDLLGANSVVEIRVVGSGMDIDLGEVQADEEGDFSAQFRLPADLAPGTYQIRAIGAKSATAEITVVGGADAEGSALVKQPAPILRQRPLGESIGLVALFGLLAGFGLFFARGARPAAG